MEIKDLFPDEFLKKFKTGYLLQQFLKYFQKRGIKKIFIVCVSLLSATLWAQDISNLEKSVLESKVKQLVIKEVNSNPIFNEFQVTNATPVKFEKRISPKDYSHITDNNDPKYGTKKGDVIMLITFYNSNNENDYIIKGSINLKDSNIRSIFRGDRMGFSGEALLNSK